MLQNDVERPFGEDEDANAAARSILSIVGQLSVESRKLAQSDFRNLNTEHAQRQLVRELQERVASAARRVHVDEDEMLEAARRMLAHRTRRNIVIHEIREGRVGDDEKLRALDREVVEAEDRLRRSRETLVRVSTRVQNQQRELDEAKRAARAHRLALLGKAAA